MKEKLNYPGGYLPEGEMWFSEYLRRLIGAILGPHPVEALPPHPSLSYYNTSACTPSEDDNAHALKVIVGTRSLLPRLCTSIAPISLRRYSKNHVSPSGKYPPGKFIFSQGSLVVKGSTFLSRVFLSL